MMEPPDIEGVVGYKVLLPIEPPLEGLRAMDCAGAVCLWCDTERFPFADSGEELSEALFPRSEFPGVHTYIYAVEEHRRKVGQPTARLWGRLRRGLFGSHLCGG